jgi:hypothetical protein
VLDYGADPTGEFAEVEQENDSALMYTDPDWIVDRAEQAVGQLLEVESVNGNTLTFSMPLNFDFSTELNAQIMPRGLFTAWDSKTFTWRRWYQRDTA